MESLDNLFCFRLYYLAKSDDKADSSLLLKRASVLVPVAHHKIFLTYVFHISPLTQISLVLSFWQIPQQGLHVLTVIPFEPRMQIFVAFENEP